MNQQVLYETTIPFSVVFMDDCFFFTEKLVGWIKFCVAEQNIRLDKIEITSTYNFDITPYSPLSIKSDSDFSFKIIRKGDKNIGILVLETSIVKSGNNEYK